MFNRREKCALTCLVLLATPALAQEVTLSLEDYEALRRRAEPPRVETPEPPVPIALESAELELAVGSESARLTMDLSLAIYVEGWQSLPLPGDGSLLSVELGELEGRVSKEHGLVCRGIGRYEVRLEAALEVAEDETAARPTRSLTLTLPKAGTVTGVVRSEVDTDELELVTGGVEHGRDENGDHRFVGNPGTALEVRLLGVARSEELASLPPIYEVSSVTLAHVERRAIALSGFLEVEVVRGELERVGILLPDAMDVLEVESVDELELGWDVGAGGALDIHFAAPATGTIRLELSLRRSLAQNETLGDFDAPLLAPVGASRSTVLSGLSSEDDGIPILVRSASARRAEASDRAFVPASWSSEMMSLFVVRDRDRPPVWRVEWAEADPMSVLVSQVDRLIVDALVGEHGRVAYQYWAVVRSPGASSLWVQPPAGFQLVSAERSGRPVSPGSTQGGVEVPLSAGHDAQVVYLAGLVERVPLPEKGTVDIPLPSLSAPVTRIDVRAVLPAEWRYEIESEDVRERIGRLPEGADRVEAPTWFRVPPGYHVVTASWSALSTRPRPLSIRANAKREKRRWY